MHKIFETNPDLKKAYITSDGTPFYQDTDAKNHAKTLKDKTVEPVFNEKELQVVDEEELTDTDHEMAEFEAAEKEKEAKAKLAQDLAEFDPAVTKYPEAVKLFKALGLDAENDKKDTIYPLLIAAQVKAKEGIEPKNEN
jgi:hypothetical protein